MNRFVRLTVIVPVLLCVCSVVGQDAAPDSRGGVYFPPPGQSLSNQRHRRPEEVGLTTEIVERINVHRIGGRWALWRHGYLVHVEGDFHEKTEVKSLRKTWHALTLGAAIQQGRVRSVDQKISVWCPELSGKDAEATWRHVITQTSGFDYPYGDHPAYKPGEMWTYSDKNPRHLCNALARVYGRRDYQDDYADVMREAYFDAIGLQGWETRIRQDGVRFLFDLEDMGRLGLLVLARGRWQGRQLIPQSFVEQLESKQTYGAAANYNGPDDGTIGLDRDEFPEAPYGFMTWTNADGDYYFGADRGWAWGRGAGGSHVLWNHRNGIVFAGFGVPSGPTLEADPRSDCLPCTIESCIAGPNPLVGAVAQAAEPLGRSGGETNASTTNAPAEASRALGRVAKWSKLEIAFTGPDSQGRGDPNPFLIDVEVVITSPRGEPFLVPGFYDGDGRGRLDGSVWKVRFSADETGEWTFASISANMQLNGHTGSFRVTDVPDDARGFWKWGRLSYPGTAENGIRYLKFRDGPYWLKAGCDDPENFLGRFRNYGTASQRNAAIDYLSERGINSLYIMSHNIGGDDSDVWPWLGQTAEEAMSHAGSDARFDVAKLDQWRELFEHMQTQGVVTYLVLEDDSAWTGYNHARYYREVIARFGYLPALVFNLGEESNENYTLSQALEFVQMLDEIDPYDHPCAIHNVNRAHDQYVDAPQVDMTSIQTGQPGTRRGLKHATEHNRLAIDWLDRCEARSRRRLVVNFDEGRPELDRRSWWSAYLGGGVWEAHVVKPYDRPHEAWEPVWTQLGGTRAFMESLPFWEMQPRNDLVRDGQALCLAKPGEAYALYLPEGGDVEVDLSGSEAYEVAWWNPDNGKEGRFQDRADVPGGVQRLTAPASGDWAVRLLTKRSR